MRIIHCQITFTQLLVKIAAVLFLLPAIALGESKQIQIFVLHSYHQEYPWTKMENVGFITGIAEKFPGTEVTYATEYLDTKRIDFSISYMDFFSEYLKKKYIHFKPDIIFSTDDNALNFLRRHKEEIFPNIPVVFSGINTISAAIPIDHEHFTGVYEVKDIVRNLALINKFWPKSSSILFVGDNSPTDRAIRQDVLKLQKNTNPETTIEFVSDKYLTSLLARIKEKKRGIILLSTIGGIHDENGVAVPLGRTIQQIQKAGDFTLISMEDVYMLDGVFGGIVTSGSKQGAKAAEFAWQILGKNTPVSDLKPLTGENLPTFDFREVKYQNFDISLLPKGSILLNQPRSLYSEFKVIIWTLIVVICILVVFLGLLSLSILRRKRAEDALAESEHFLNSVIENIPDMIFVKSASDLRFVRLNRAGEQLLGRPAEEVIGKSDHDLFPEKEVAFFTRKDREVLEKKNMLNIPEETILTPSGTRYLHTQKIPIIGANGEPSYLLGISRDITKQKMEMEKRQELEERLLHAEKLESIGTLAGGIAHDFNNILSSIIGYTELARVEAEKPEKVRDFLSGTLKGTDRAKDLIRQILTFSRKSEHHMTPLNPVKVIEEALNMLRSTLPSTVSFAENLKSDGSILADPTQIHQIVLNLCTNGYHAMREHGGTLTVSLKKVEINLPEEQLLGKIPAGNYLRLEVSDTGHGMDAETQQRMFDPYYTTKGSETGTGLGLAVVHGIVKSHNGYIQAFSEEGAGTTIHVYFPVLRDVTSTADAALGRTTPPAYVVNGNEHIAVVDDERDILDIASHLLVRHGYQVTSFRHAEDALRTFRLMPTAFDLLITDMTMPGITGADLAREVLNLVPTLPVVLCTGHSEIITREKAVALGIYAYCEKPVSPEELLITIRQALDDRKKLVQAGGVRFLNQL